MATNTTNLGLILPGFGEFTDDWWEPLNKNFGTIDASVGTVTAEVVAARQGKSSLLAFLQVGHNADGSLVAAPEVVAARSSPIYGHRDGGGNLVPLKSRLSNLDFELLKARYSQASLIDGLSLIQPGLKDVVLSGAANVNGYPAWMSNTGANVQIDGSVTPIYFLIGGYAARIRTLKTITISGGAGTYYLYATYQSGGTITVDGDSSSPPPVAANGQTSQDTNLDMTLFTDLTQNFLTADVHVGDTLTLLTSNDAGTYVVKLVAPAGQQTQLQVIGVFPVGGLSAINYTVRDPLGVVLGFSATAPVTAGRIYIGEADFDGTAITAVRPRAFRGIFNGEYRQFDVSTISSHEEIWSHNLGTDLLDVEVQVSQANDGSQPVELLSQADMQNTLGVSVTDTHALNFSNTLLFSPGSSNASLQGTVTSSLGGTVTAALTGGVTPTRSVTVKWDRNRIYVKNTTPSLLYKDYAGTTHQTGYVRVVVRKRG